MLSNSASGDSVGAATGGAMLRVVAAAVLFDATGSLVALLAVTTRLTEPLAGAVNDTVHDNVLPAASVAADDAGTHAVLAPTGRPAIAQVTLLALLGPLLMQA
jgi:mRNA-degrading endonuclease toxin of MazEF toxin-antitoxin module